MKIQLALDRLKIAEAINVARQVEESVDWIEVGTSLIKEFGVTSIKKIKHAFPHKIIVADVKTNDNARYEFEMCFEAGADVATVMGVSPLITIDICMEVAKRYNKKVMIDLLNTSEQQKLELQKYKDAIFCLHVSKDQQEEAGMANRGAAANQLNNNLQIAAAGGININTLEQLKSTVNPDVLIVGGAIVKAENPSEAAFQFKQKIAQIEGK
jgi:3-hexulose-6-phosphate synthase